MCCAMFTKEATSFISLITLTWLTCTISLFLHAVKRVAFSGPQKCMTPRGLWPWGIQIGPFRVHKTHFVYLDLLFITNHMQHFPFPASREKGTAQNTQKVSYTKVGHPTNIRKIRISNMSLSIPAF